MTELVGVTLTCLFVLLISQAIELFIVQIDTRGVAVLGLAAFLRKLGVEVKTDDRAI